MNDTLKKVYKKRLKKHLNFQLDKSLVKKWGKNFWCPHFHQWTMLALCNRRRLIAVDHACYQACVSCPIRRHSFRKLRKPTLRQPNLDTSHDRD